MLAATKMLLRFRVGPLEWAAKERFYGKLYLWFCVSSTFNVINSCLHSVKNPLIPESTLRWFWHRCLCLHSPHGIAMLKGLYFTAVVFFFLFFLLFFDAYFLRSLNGSQLNLNTYSTYSLISAIWKIWCELPWAFIAHGLGAKIAFWDRLWTLTEHNLQRNIWYQQSEKNLSIYRYFHAYHKFGELCSRNGWERLASSCLLPHLYFCIGRHCQSYRMDVI